jgi:hypothetical protein
MNRCKNNEKYRFDAEGDKCLNCDYYEECLDIYERYYLN